MASVYPPIKSSHASISNQGWEPMAPAEPGRLYVTPPAAHPLWRRQHTWWSWELAAATLSLLATVALVALLARTDQRPQRSWAFIGHSEITLNTLVAAISTVMRSAMLITVAGALNQSAWNWFAASTRHTASAGHPLRDLDIFGEAAMNSWNSGRLLWRTKGRHLASLGALLVILSLVFDALTQQVLTIEIRPQQAVLSGTNLTAQNVLPRMASFLSFEPDDGTNNGINAPVEDAIMNGIFSSNNSLPGAVCPTGNCSWPVTPTINVCGACSEAKEQVVIEKDASTNSIMLTMNWNYSVYEVPFNFLGSSINISLQNPSFLSPIYLLSSAYFESAPPSNSTGRPQIAAFNSFGIPQSAIDQINNMNDSGFAWEPAVQDLIFAYNCSLYFCIQGVAGGFSEGKMDQHIVPTSIDEMVLDNIDGNWTLEADAPLEELNVHNASAYIIQDDSRAFFGRQISSILTGQGWIALNHPAGQPDLMNASDTMTHRVWTASESLQNITDLTQNIAQSLGTYVRTTPALGGVGSSGAFDPQYAPMVSTLVPFVRVRWAWLSYPLILVLGGILFLLLTIAATRRRRVHPWKGHRLPLLLARVDESIFARVRETPTSYGKLDTWVGNARVKLECDDAGSIAFRQVPTPAMRDVNTAMLTRRSLS